MEKTKVTFRKLDGNIIALFPDNVIRGGAFIKSYELYSTNPGATWIGVLEWERAEPEEYADLLAELVDLGYDLEVV